MLKITKSIVDGNRSLIGFIVEGKQKEFGQLGNEKVEVSIPIANIIKDKFSNNQISVVNNKIVERSNFKINQLPMVVWTGENYIDVPDNTVNLLQRFVKDNENIGFRVKFFDGSEDNLSYSSILMMCKWFKPGNFSIRTSAKGRQYICGKNGNLRVDELPAVVIGKEPEVKAKRTKSAAKDAKPEFNGDIETGFDILDIYGFIKECSGCVIKLPSENYVAASEDGETMLENFTSLGIGEVASANPKFNPTKINVNGDFKKVGIVPVTINGVPQNIVTFTYRSKSIFLNGENYMKKFGIAVPTEKEADLLNLLSRSLALEKIEDPSVIQPLSQVINVKSLSFYKVDSSKIDLISEKKRSESIMTAKQIVSLCKKQYELKLISKAMGPKGGLMKNIKVALGDDEIAIAKDKKLFGIFGMMNEESLNAVKEAGIDVYSGAYTVPGKPYAKPASKGDGDDYDEPVEIEYILKGYDASKLTGSKILDAVKANDKTTLPDTVIKAVNEVLAITDLHKQYVAASKLYGATEGKLDELSKKLWMHNASMYLNGNKSRIHVHDSKNWIPDTSSKVKKAQVYTCTLKGTEGLTVKFTGVNI